MTEWKTLNLSMIANQVQEEYSNFILEQANDHCVRIAVFTGDYQWHYHPDSDEIFMVLEGELLMDLPDGITLAIGPGEVFKVPAGVMHRTRAQVRTVNLCFEREEAATIFAEPTQEKV
ncbi:cupin domain-containing protein [Paenibacillus bovis]|uniref:Cupin type-2 domain-containing protein n=1 Tax=Paenibacillus bovis TaxID=1616788 RepID=A0A172ZB29_9BACL|nr:cupin domain-containing protein [Paenibacillus bovis]ANF94846.1 hypothetical protein AR543_01565 [Paenibacillus bovis]